MNAGGTGGPSGTNAASAMNPVARFAYDRLLMRGIAPRLGLAHPVNAGAARLRLAMTDRSYADGISYASAANTLTGPLVDQSSIFRDLANPTYQDNAYEAVHRFLDNRFATS